MLFPHHEPIEVDGLELPASQVIELLDAQISERRRERIENVVNGRVYSVIPVLDALYDRGNISAVMRTAEGLGCGEIHVVESQEEKFKAANRVTQGADKWLDVRKWQRPQGCIDNLRERGFQIVATSLQAATPLSDVDFNRPTALVFGNERDGVCDEILEASDARVILPMAGFAQSFNISVAAALMLYHALLHRDGGDLDEEQRRVLKALYYLRSGENHAAIIRRKLQGPAVTSP